jgi:hypothetical protein
MSELVENIDYYYDNGYMVFTAKYLSERGYCCGNGCRHCPYNYINVPEPERTRLEIQQASSNSNKDITTDNT